MIGQLQASGFYLISKVFYILEKVITIICFILKKKEVTFLIVSDGKIENDKMIGYQLTDHHWLTITELMHTVEVSYARPKYYKFLNKRYTKSYE